jgi:hypothetical protein
VAQIGNLLYRRLLIGSGTKWDTHRPARGLTIRATADYQSAAPLGGKIDLRPNATKIKA